MLVPFVSEAHFQIGDEVVELEVNLLVLHATPEALDEHVVERASTTVNADRHTVALQAHGERFAGVLLP